MGASLSFGLDFVGKRRLLLFARDSVGSKSYRSGSGGILHGPIFALTLGFCVNDDIGDFAM